MVRWGHTNWIWRRVSICWRLEVLFAQKGGEAVERRETDVLTKMLVESMWSCVVSLSGGDGRVG